MRTLVVRIYSRCRDRAGAQRQGTRTGDPMAAQNIQALYDEAAWRAERSVALLRLAVALIVGLVFYFAAGQFSGDIVLARQLVLAGATIVGYLILGLVALWVVASRNFRPWMAWLFSTTDVLLLLASLDAVMANSRMPGFYLASAPALWLAPAILAFGVLRFNPLLQAYIVALALAGFALIVVLHTPAAGTSAAEDVPGHVPRLFAVPPNIMRFVMVALFGAVLIAAAIRARALLIQAIADGTRRANLTRYLPMQIA
jgi:adenylate cyclase